MIGAWIDPGSNRYETWRVNADGSGRTRLPIPEGDLVLDASRDGPWLATRTMGGDPNHLGRLTLVHHDGTGARYLTEGSAKDDRFSIFKIAPDGRSVAYVEITTVEQVRHAELFVVDIEGRHRRRIPTHFEPGTTVVVYWSPDGSRLALSLINGETKEGSIVDRGHGRPELPPPQDPPAARAMEPLRLRLEDARSGLRLGAADGPPDPKTLGADTRPSSRNEKARKAYRQALRGRRRPRSGRGLSGEVPPRGRTSAGSSRSPSRRPTTRRPLMR